MANQIPQALQQFAQFLRQENERLDEENKTHNINRVVSQTATAFEELGPDATKEDTRKVMFESMRNAAKYEVSGETTPYIQTTYQNAIKTINENKLEKQQGIISDYVKQRYGTGIEGLTGDQQLKLLMTDKDLTRPEYITTEEGGIRTKVLQGLRYTGYGYEKLPNPIEVERKDLNAEAARKRKFLNPSAYQYRRTNEMDTDRKHVLDFFPATGVRSYIDEKTGKRVPYYGPVVKFQTEYGPLLDKEKLYRNIEKGSYIDLSLPITALSATLYNNLSDSDMTGELKTILFNTSTQQFNKETLATIRNLAKTEAHGGTSQLWQLVTKLPEGDIRNRAIQQYQELETKLFEYDAAQHQLLKSRGITESDVVGMTVKEYDDWTKEIEEGLQDNNIKEGWLNNLNNAYIIARKTYKGFGKEPVGPIASLKLDYKTWVSLDPKIKAAVIHLLYRQTPEGRAK